MANPDEDAPKITRITVRCMVQRCTRFGTEVTVPAGVMVAEHVFSPYHHKCAYCGSDMQTVGKVL